MHSAEFVNADNCVRNISRFRARISSVSIVLDGSICKRNDIFILGKLGSGNYQLIGFCRKKNSFVLSKTLEYRPLSNVNVTEFIFLSFETF